MKNWTSAAVERLQQGKSAAPKTTKYKNQKTTVDGIKFDSKKEAARYIWLNLEQRSGYIDSLERQVTYLLTCNGHPVCKYVADFVYNRGSERIVEDVKSEMTRKLPVYRIKKKFMLACHGITINEV